MPGHSMPQPQQHLATVCMALLPVLPQLHTALSAPAASGSNTAQHTPAQPPAHCQPHLATQRQQHACRQQAHCHHPALLSPCSFLKVQPSRICRITARCSTPQLAISPACMARIPSCTRLPVRTTGTMGTAATQRAHALDQSPLPHSTSMQQPWTSHQPADARCQP